MCDLFTKELSATGRVRKSVSCVQTDDSTAWKTDTSFTSVPPQRCSGRKKKKKVVKLKRWTCFKSIKFMPAYSLGRLTVYTVVVVTKGELITTLKTFQSCKILSRNFLLEVICCLISLQTLDFLDGIFLPVPETTCLHPRSPLYFFNIEIFVGFHLKWNLLTIRKMQNNTSPIFWRD